MEQAIETSSVWMHKRNGYTVVIADLSFERIMSKDANDAREQEAVGYLHDDDQETLHIRTAADFLAKFEEVTH